MILVACCAKPKKCSSKFPTCRTSSTRRASKVVPGAREFESIKIDAEVVDPAEVEMLEDLVGAAVKEALKQAETAHSEAMKGVTGGMGLPGMM